MMRLSSREHQLAKLLAMGETNREIADALRISIKTVDTHRGHILKKLHLRNNVDLARHALRAGWVDINEPGKPPTLTIIDTTVKPDLDRLDRLASPPQP